MVNALIDGFGFDPDNPPEEPPEHTDRLMWKISYQVYIDHAQSDDGRCIVRSCGGAPWPCVPHNLGRSLLVLAAQKRWKVAAEWISH